MRRLLFIAEDASLGYGWDDDDAVDFQRIRRSVDIEDQDDILRQQSRGIHGGKRNQFISVMRQDCNAIDVKYINRAKDNEIRENNKNESQEYYACISLHV